MSATDRERLVANADMAAAWAAEGEEWARAWERYDRCVARHHAALLEAAAIDVAHHVIDIGCGNGQVARDAARTATDGDALGVDLSPAMLARARELADAEACRNVSFLRADAQVHRFEPDRADVVVSRFGAMFFADPIAAFANLARATKRGGRLALVAWRELSANEWLLTIRRALAAGRDLPTPPTGVPGPFGLADVDRAAAWLAAAGFDQIGIDAVHAAVWLGHDCDDAMAFVLRGGMARGLLADLDETERSRAVDSLRLALLEHDLPGGVELDSSAWLITARRIG